jgi:hypothetical protein
MEIQLDSPVSMAGGMPPGGMMNGGMPPGGMMNGGMPPAGMMPGQQY